MLDRLALDHQILKRIGGLRQFIAIQQIMERFPANQPPAPKNIDRAPIGDTIEPAAYADLITIGHQRRRALLRRAPRCDEGILQQVACKLWIMHKTAEEDMERLGVAS